MTIAELIAALGQYPPELAVLTPGYEGGYADLTPENLQLRRIQREVNQEWYYGPHEDFDPDDPRPIAAALILTRPRRPAA